MNAKRKGNRNEHRSILLLESAGYRVPAPPHHWVSSMSALDPPTLSWCSARPAIGQARSKWEPILNFQCPPLCKKIIHRWPDRARLPDVRTI